MQFTFEHKVPLPREVVFSFHRNPAHLVLLHSPWSKFEILAHEPEVRVGGETWVEQTVAGIIPIVLGFRHHLYEPAVRFGEHLIHGPFSRFVHIHEFVNEQGQTLVRDLLEVDWPWEYGGRVVMHRVITRKLKQMFRNRAEALSRLAQDGTIERCALNQQSRQTS